MEHSDNFDYESINGISIINKNNTLKDFKIWVTNNRQLSNIIKCIN